MSAFRRGNGWVSKFQYRGRQQWVPGGPWETKRQAEEAERRRRDRLEARRTKETCASFAERTLTCSTVRAVRRSTRVPTSTPGGRSALRLG